MLQKDSKTIDTLKSLQEREQEHFLQLSLCNALSKVNNSNDLVVVIKQLKEIIGFDTFVICTTDEAEKEYGIFFHDNSILQSEYSDAVYSVKGSFFDLALKSVEPIVFNLHKIKSNQKNNIPNFIQREGQSAMTELIVLPLDYHKDNPSVLFIFFKKPRGFTCKTKRLLNSLSLQMALTVSKCLLIKKIEMYRSRPISKSFDNNNKISKVENGYSGIIGTGKAMQKVIELVKQVTNSDCGVLLLGESGTGKDIVANAIHKNSVYQNKEMVRLNCAAIPANLIESELFGHEKGSFTGAVELRIGKFEQAHNNTLFLDEIGELPLNLQAKLLRVLQERKFERIGGNKIIKVNVRILAATNKDLHHEVTIGRFRSDLYYRLNTFPITIPALRDHSEDIPLLSRYFITAYCNRVGRKKFSIAAKVIDAMTIYPWPGNVRELKNHIERTALLTSGNTITEICLPENEKNNAVDERLYIKTLDEVEKEYILSIINLCNGRLSGPNGAAKKLGLPNTTLISRMKKLGINKKHSINSDAK